MTLIGFEPAIYSATEIRRHWFFSTTPWRIGSSLFKLKELCLLFDSKLFFFLLFCLFLWRKNERSDRKPFEQV